MYKRIEKIQALLTVVAIIALLSWGVYSILWIYPNDTATALQAISDGEHIVTGYAGPKGNGTMVPPGSEARFTLTYTTGLLPGSGGGDYLEPNGLGFGVGPFGWTAPRSSITNYDVNYAVFSFLFGTQMGPANPLWFTGPQGNLTVSLFTGLSNKLQGFFPKLSVATVSGTNILEVSTVGNYTLHFRNIGNVTDSSWVEIGPSSVNYSRPYFVPAGITISLGAALAVLTIVVPWRNSRKPALSPTT